jgi:hypothetical protein
MEATCNHCSHWEQNKAEVKIQDNDFGVCNELTGQHAMEPEYVLPLLHEGQAVNKKVSDFEMITGAMFGCNHFAERR